MRDYKKIKAYQFANQLAVEIYKLTASFPKNELYGLVSQVRRAAVSVACNIVEGSNRQTGKDYLHFLYIAKASLAEARYLIELSCQLGYVAETDYKGLEVLREETAKTLHGLIEAVHKNVE
ncbi:MAG: four helix bundle protein [Candidatus Omnitrophota bacterium]